MERTSQITRFLPAFRAGEGVRATVEAFSSVISASRYSQAGNFADRCLLGIACKAGG